jgi:ketol-acid reductoisomerase
VKNGAETARVISACGQPNYKQLLDAELAEMGSSEMWLAGKAVRSLRPKEKAKAITKKTKGVAGRGKN